MIELGAVGSPVDVATLLALLVVYRYDLRDRLDALAAAVVALARREPGVDADRLQDDLDVDDEAVDAVEPTVVACGGEPGAAA